MPTGIVASVQHSDVMYSAVTFTWQPVPCTERGGSLVMYDVVVKDIGTWYVLTNANSIKLVQS